MIPTQRRYLIKQLVLIDEVIGEIVTDLNPYTIRETIEILTAQRFETDKQYQEYKKKVKAGVIK